MHANGQPIFQTTAVNEAYLSYHPRSVSKFTKKYKAWSYTKFTPNWNTSSSYSPPLLSPTTPTPVTNQNTYGYEKNPNIHQYTWQYIIVSIKYFSTRKFTGSNFSIWHTRNKSTYWLFSPSGHHYTWRSWNSHYPTATRPPPDINASDDLANTSTTMNLSIISTTPLPSYISEHTPLFQYYELYISTPMLQQLEVKR